MPIYKTVISQKKSANPTKGYADYIPVFSSYSHEFLFGKKLFLSDRFINLFSLIIISYLFQNCNTFPTVFDIRALFRINREKTYAGACRRMPVMPIMIMILTMIMILIMKKTVLSSSRNIIAYTGI